MKIKTIVDKIIKEADIQANNYSVTDRLEDVSEIYFEYVEKAAQIGSKIPPSKSEATSETFTVVAGSNTFARTIKDVPILRVDFMPTGSSYYQEVTEDPKRRMNHFCLGGTTFFANEKQFFIENGVAGTLRVTYARGTLVAFTQADYDGDTVTPDFLPEAFHPLLYLRLALVQARYYKPDRVQGIMDRIEPLQILFENHYGRDSVHDSQIVTEESDDCFGGSNYR